jgi:hypothetical protein
MVEQLEIIRASLEDTIEILALQKLAYQSEAQIYNDWTIPPLLQTAEEIQDEFSTHMFLKAVIKHSIVDLYELVRRHYLPHRQADRVPEVA